MTFESKSGSFKKRMFFIFMLLVVLFVSDLKLSYAKDLENKDAITSQNISSNLRFIIDFERVFSGHNSNSIENLLKNFQKDTGVYLFIVSSKQIPSNDFLSDFEVFYDNAFGNNYNPTFSYFSRDFNKTVELSKEDLLSFAMLDPSRTLVILTNNKGNYSFYFPETFSFLKDFELKALFDYYLGDLYPRGGFLRPSMVFQMK